MVLRLSLIIAILTAGAALYFSRFKVAERINVLTADLATAQSERDQANQEAAENKKRADETQAKLEEAGNALAQLGKEFEATKSALAVQQERADRLNADLERTLGERNEAQQETARWRALGLSIEQVLTLRENLAKMRAERDTLDQRNQELTRRSTDLEKRLAVYEPTGAAEPTLPPGTKGRVVAVDPKYDFVVLDLGEKDEVLENAKMLVMRDGKLIGQVRIIKVHPNRSVANVMPDWKQDEIMEGDVVLSR